MVAERYEQRDHRHEVRVQDALRLGEVAFALELIAQHTVGDQRDVQLPGQRGHGGGDRRVGRARRGEVHLARADHRAGVAQRRDQRAQLLRVAPGKEQARAAARVHVRDLGGDRRRGAEDRDALAARLPDRASRHGATTRSNMPPATSR